MVHNTVVTLIAKNNYLFIAFTPSVSIGYPGGVEESRQVFKGKHVHKIYRSLK